MKWGWCEVGEVIKDKRLLRKGLCVKMGLAVFCLGRGALLRGLPTQCSQCGDLGINPRWDIEYQPRKGFIIIAFYICIFIFRRKLNRPIVVHVFSLGVL